LTTPAGAPVFDAGKPEAKAFDFHSCGTAEAVP